MKSSVNTGRGYTLESKGVKAERAENIARMQADLNAQTPGGILSSGVHDDIKGTALEQSFWEYITAYENAPRGTHMEQLREAGIEMPDADVLNDAELNTVLWRVIEGLAELRVFLDQTDHLDDRALYNLLRSDLLVQDTVILPVHPDSATHLDILGGWGDEDCFIYYKYYATDMDRQDWMLQCPDYEMPDPVDLPFDRVLPKA